MLRTANVVTVTIAILLAYLRIEGVKHVAFQAAAHLFVGGLIGAWIVLWRAGDGGWFAGRKGLPLVLAVALSTVEVACFMAHELRA